MKTKTKFLREREIALRKYFEGRTFRKELEERRLKLSKELEERENREFEELRKNRIERISTSWNNLNSENPT